MEGASAPSKTRSTFTPPRGLNVERSEKAKLSHGKRGASAPPPKKPKIELPLLLFVAWLLLISLRFVVCLSAFACSCYVCVCCLWFVAVVYILRCGSCFGVLFFLIKY